MIPQPIPPSQNPCLSNLNKSCSWDNTNRLKSTICPHFFVSAACHPAQRIIYLTLILHIMLGVHFESDSRRPAHMGCASRGSRDEQLWQLSSVWSWRSQNWHFARSVLVYFLQPKALGQNLKVCLEAPLQSIKRKCIKLYKRNALVTLHISIRPSIIFLTLSL